MRIFCSPGGVCAAAVASLALLGTSAAAETEEGVASPEALVARAFANLYGFTSVQRVEVRARRAGGREFKRSVQVARRGVADSLNRMRVRFLGPGDLRGIGLLLLERPDYSYDAFLYQPVYQRVRRITMAQRHDAFFGTDVAFEDLEAKRATQWQTRLLRRESLHERRTWVIELEPDGVPSGYDRVVSWFDVALPVMLRTEFYRHGKRLKTLDVDPHRIVEVDGYFVPSLMTFRGASDSVTVVEISEIELRRKLPDELFTIMSLEFGSERWDVGAQLVPSKGGQ